MSRTKLKYPDTFGTFARDVAKLSLGTLLGRIISLASLPLIARLYTPEDFSILALFLAVVGPLGAAACLRFEIAIPLAKREKEAASLAVLAILSLLTFSTTLLILIIIFSRPIASALENAEFEKYLILIPISVFLVGTFSILQLWATAKRRFTSIAKTRVWQATLGSGTTIALGVIGFTPVGLLIGSIFNIGVGGVGLALSAVKSDRRSFSKLSVARILKSFKTHLRYPLYSAPESILNAASLQLPVLIIAIKDGAEAGHLALAIQLMAIPMALIGHSISQVYSSRLVEEQRKRTLNPFTTSIMKRLFIFGGLPIVIAGIIAPHVFDTIFGSNWIRSGEIILWMTPWITLQLMTSPVATVLLAVGWQNIMLILTLIGFLFRTLSVLSAFHLNYSAPEALAVASALFYAIVCGAVIIASRRYNTP